MHIMQYWLPETPASLAQAGQLAEGRCSLQQLRGAFSNVDAEFEQIVRAANLSMQVGVCARCSH